MKIYFILFLFCLIGYKGNASRVASEESNPQRILILHSYSENTTWSTQLIHEIDSLLSSQYPDLHIYIGNLNCDEPSNHSSLQLGLRAALWQMAEQEGETFNVHTDLSLASIFPREVRPDAIVLLGDEAEAVYKMLHLVMGKWKYIPTVSCAVFEERPHITWIPENKPDFLQLEPNKNLLVKNAVARAFKQHQAYLQYMGKDAIPQDCVLLEGEWFYINRLPNTKIYSRLFIKENLEMMKQLMPETKEIVWVDDSYLKTDYTLFKLKQEVGKIFPQARFTAITHNKLNTDSIFDMMMEPVKNRFFITYSWNTNGLYSLRPEKNLDSLFNQVLSCPIVTLSERNLENNNYWLGGVHFRPEECALKTFQAIDQILKGNAVDSIPQQTLTHAETHLNMTALKRFGLANRVKTLKGDLVLLNIPPSFYEKYERQILGITIVLFLLAGIYIFFISRRRFTKAMQRESENYQRLYDKLHTIYQTSSLNFALYDDKGQLLFRITDGQKYTLPPDKNELFTKNLFSNPYLNKELKSQIKARQNVSCELEITFNNPKKQFFQLVIKPLEANVYGRACYMAIATDLTSVMQERQAKKETEHMFNYISESAQIGVAIYNILDGEGFATPRWYENLNEEPQKGVLPAYKQVSAGDREQLLAHQNKIKQVHIQQPFAQDIQVTDKEGTSHWIREYIFIKSFAPQKGEILVVELNQNVDAEKHRETKLEYLKEQAEISNRETQQFLTNISHEIRTPLNAIVGFSSLLGSCDNSDEISTLMPIITQNNQLLVALIDNILHLSKIDSGTFTFHFAPIELQTVFKNWETYAQKNLNNKSLSLFLELPAETAILYTDEVQLDTVMKNLISNAVKFTDTGNIVIGYRREKEKHYFFVKDTGIGIPLEKQKLIFKRFEKLNSFTQGTGLGLALCRSIILHLGGEIGVESAPGQGSLFYFTLSDKIE
ncbi:sensor histidine kinase [Odoribacter laneus]|uniref:sensor histidine kinase n=1 Tax=Odoribacter laneus TaxID=626933 RepID=UPI00033FA257|nr:HAMP domain-containing sensor histidine kinase [Odoribacter laneus]CCZ80536.1 putative uncharacterized protein [Odoribacter laneus CAG:561]